MRRHILAAFLLCLSALSLHAATLEQLSLDDMIAKSSSIVRARVLDGSYSAYSGSVIYTHFPLRVAERFKGQTRVIDVAVPGGAVGQVSQRFEGTPELKAGEEYVFFLWTSPSGLTQVIGLTQGLFALGSGDSGPVVTRRASSERMIARGTGRPVKDEALVMPLSALRSRIAAALGRGDAK